jgi:hypothetical protein
MLRPRSRGPVPATVLTVVALLAASLALVQDAGPAAAAPASVLGVYAGAAYPQAVRDFTTTVGAQPPFAMDFLDGATWRTITQGRWPYTKWKGAGYTMIWGVNMLPDTYTPNADAAQAGGSCFGLTQGATGAFDHYFQTVAANIVRAGFPVSVIRFGWEFNGNWFPWSAQGCASAYVRYFDDIVTTMRSVPGSHFTFEWNATRGDLGVGNLSQYYPGNKYVDDIGLDVYDVEKTTYPGARAEFRHMLTQRDGLNWLVAFGAAHHKPIVLPEWGLGFGTCSASGQRITAAGQQVCGGDNATWVNLMADWIATHHVAEATYWDFDTSSVRRGQNPLTAKVLATHYGPSRTAEDPGPTS